MASRTQLPPSLTMRLHSQPAGPTINISPDLDVKKAGVKAN
jgi:hypothetical protein